MGQACTLHSSLVGGFGCGQAPSATRDWTPLVSSAQTTRRSRKPLPQSFVQEPHSSEIHLGGHWCVLQWSTVGSGRAVPLHRDSSTAASLSRFLHVGLAIL